jgi:aldose 1-epimerase
MRIIELATHDAKLRIAPETGGAIVAFTLREREILRPMPAAAIAARDVRLAACYPLVPYSNRIRDARLTFGGRDYALARNFGDHPHAIHGVGWQRPWSVAETSPQHARITLRHAARGADAAAWPWPFHATQTFRIAERMDAGGARAALFVATLTLVNTGSEPFPFGLGWHPYFPKDATTRLGFAADAVWRNDPTELPRRRSAIPARWRFDPPRALGSLALDNVFVGWRGRAVLARPAQALATTLDADRACAFAVVYAPPGRDFVAVEPVTHETDAFNRAARGAAGTGLRVLPPGAAFSCTMRVAAAALAGPVSPANPAR